jgi:O-antigen ligase
MILGLTLIVMVLLGAISSAKPRVGLVCFFALVPWVLTLPLGLPINLAAGEVMGLVLLMVASGRALTGRQRLRMGPVIWPILFYLVICVISSLADFRGGTTTVSILQMCLYFFGITLAIKYSGSMLDLRAGLLAGTVSCGVIALCVITVGFGAINMHKNAAGASLAGGMIMATGLLLTTPPSQTVLRKWLIVVLFVIGVGLVLTVSRGGWLGTIAGVTVMMAIYGRLRRFWPILAGAVVAATIAWSILPEHLREFATGFEAERWNIRLRLESFERAKYFFLQDPLLGSGVGLRKVIDSTNVMMTVLAETGVLGFVGFFGIHAAIVLLAFQAARRLPGDSPLKAMIAVGVGLLIGRLAHGMVDHYWSRGVLALGWAGAAMALRGIEQTFRATPVSTKSRRRLPATL